MSAEAMAWAWRQAERLEPIELLMLLAVTDQADLDRGVALSIPALAAKCGLELSIAERAIGALVANGYGTARQNVFVFASDMREERR